MNVKFLFVSTLVFAVLVVTSPSASANQPPWMDASIAALETGLVDKHGETQRSRLQRGLRQAANFWRAAEIGAVALVDIAVWRWMYDNPEASPAELRQATVQISKDVWNRYFAGIFNIEDVTLLGVYSHMINRSIYLPNYPIGAMISRQLEEHIAESGDLGAEFERMCLSGNIAPDLWMKHATGQPVGPEALLEAAERALDLYGD